MYSVRSGPIENVNASIRGGPSFHEHEREIEVGADRQACRNYFLSNWPWSDNQTGQRLSSHPFRTRQNDNELLRRILKQGFSAALSKLFRHVEYLWLKVERNLAVKPGTTTVREEMGLEPFHSIPAGWVFSSLFSLSLPANERGGKWKFLSNEDCVTLCCFGEHNGSFQGRAGAKPFPLARTCFSIYLWFCLVDSCRPCLSWPVFDRLARLKRPRVTIVSKQSLAL